MHYFDQFKGLPKQVYLIGLCRVIAGIGNMSYAFLSLHLRSFLGLSEVNVGLVSLLVSFAGICGGLAGGKLADKYGRKKIAMIVFFAQMVMDILCGVMWQNKIVCGLLVVKQFVHFASTPIFSAMVADNAPQERSIDCFSFVYFCANVGVAIGPAIGGEIFYDHTALTYALQSVGIALSLIVFIPFVKDNYNPSLRMKEAQKEAVNSTAKIETKEESLISIILHNKMLLIFIATFALVSMSYQMTNFMLSMQTTDLFGIEISAKYAGLVWTTNGAVIVALTPLFLKYTRKHHQFFNMTLGIALYAVGYTSYAFIKTPIQVIIGAVIWTIGEILISTGAGAFLANNSPATHVARIQSTYETTRSIGRMAAPAIFGFLLQYINYSQAWLANGVLCAAMAGLIFFSWKKNGCPKY